MSSYFANVAATGSWGTTTQEQYAYMQGQRASPAYTDHAQAYTQYGAMGMQAYRYAGNYPGLTNLPATHKGTYDHGSPAHTSPSPGPTAYDPCQGYYSGVISPRSDQTPAQPLPTPQQATHAISPANSDFTSAKMNTYANQMSCLTPPPPSLPPSVPTNALSPTDALSHSYNSVQEPVMQPYTSKTQIPTNYYQWVKAYPAGWC